jgi:MFS family permease
MLMLVNLSTSFSMGIIAPILGIYVRSKGLGMTQVGLVGTASMFGWFIFEPIMGLVSDRFNKRLMLAGALFFTTLLYLLYPLANSFNFFAVLEFARSSIMSAYSIPVRVFAAELLPVEDRGRTYGRYMMIISLGGLVSPIVGGYISEVLGLSVPFYIAAGTGLLGILSVSAIRTVESLEAVETGHTMGIRSFLTGSVLAIYSVRGLYFFNAGFTGSFLSIFLNESPQFKASEAEVGAFFTVMRLVGTASTSFIGDICDRIGKSPVITGSLAGTGLSYIGLIFTAGPTSMFIIGALQGLFQASADTGMMLQLIDVMPKARSGLIMGLYSEAENVGGIISTPTMGVLYQSFGGNSVLLLLVAAMLLNAFYSYTVIQGTPHDRSNPLSLSLQ